MTRHVSLSTMVVLLTSTGFAVAADATGAKSWKVHDMKRPFPRIVAPGDRPSDPPSDAIVLFDGKDLSKWETVSKKGGPPRWKLDGGVLTVVPLTGSIRTKQSFGDCQLHVEWMAFEGSNSNSGVFLQGLYEVQIYNSYKNKHRIYADGVAAAKYGQHPPLVNACRAPGKWQTFDIVYHGPRFDKDGKLLRPATMTVLHNGVLVQDHMTVLGFTVHGKKATYRPHPPELPLLLQNHSNPVSFRNIWIRPLPEQAEGAASH